jgi:hypothetical protein
MAMANVVTGEVSDVFDEAFMVLISRGYEVAPLDFPQISIKDEGHQLLKDDQEHS